MNIPLPLVLASGSPRRRELLARLGMPFEVVISQVDETALQAPTPLEFARLAAAEKCVDVAAGMQEQSVVIGADTIVCLDPCDTSKVPSARIFEDGEIVLGKPSGPSEAIEMLRLLSGRVHRVITGVAVLGVDAEMIVDADITSVRFKQLSHERIESYVATSEPLDKAGAYGAQGEAAGLIQSIDGDLNNVIGLPLHRLAIHLARRYPQIQIPGIEKGPF